MSDQSDSFEDAAPEAAQREVHLKDYLDILVKRRKLILLCVSLALLGGIVLTVLTRPQFKATAVRRPNSKARRLITGSVPGSPSETGSVCVLGGSPKSVPLDENILLSV